MSFEILHELTPFQLDILRACWVNTPDAWAAVSGHQRRGLRQEAFGRLVALGLLQQGPCDGPGQLAFRVTHTGHTLIEALAAAARILGDFEATTGGSAAPPVVEVWGRARDDTAAGL